MLNLCTFEDRKTHWIGLKFLSLSLEKYCTNFHLTIFISYDSYELSSWIENNCKYVSLRVHEFYNTGWNIKPEVLLLMLNEGHQEVVWLDSDIIFVQNIQNIAKNLSPETLLICQDALRNSREKERTNFFNLKIKRELGESINTSFIRVHNNKQHLDLLKEWARLMTTKEYKKNQSLPRNQRPSYMVGDQDVLEAILASDLHFNPASIPIKYLYTGKEHITAIVPHAFSILERLKTFFGFNKPYIINSQGGVKPWKAKNWGNGLLTTPIWQLHPYIELVKGYKPLLEEDFISEISSYSIISNFCRVITINNPYLQGIPLIIMIDIWSKINIFKKLLSPLTNKLKFILLQFTET